MSKHGNIHIGEKELVLEVISQASGKPEMMSFSWSDILSVKVVNGTEKKFPFIKKEFEHIVISTSNPETPTYKMPVIIDKEKTKDKFEEYLDAFVQLSKVKPFKFEDRRKKTG